MFIDEGEEESDDIFEGLRTHTHKAIMHTCDENPDSKHTQITPPRPGHTNINCIQDTNNHTSRIQIRRKQTTAMTTTNT